jgi:hypothetical protein
MGDTAAQSAWISLSKFLIFGGRVDFSAESLE